MSLCVFEGSVHNSFAGKISRVGTHMPEKGSADHAGIYGYLSSRFISFSAHKLNVRIAKGHGVKKLCSPVCPGVWIYLMRLNQLLSTAILGSVNAGHIQDGKLAWSRGAVRILGNSRGLLSHVFLLISKKEDRYVCHVGCRRLC